MDEELKEIIKVNYNKAEDDISYNFLRFKYFDNIKKKKKKEKDAKSNLIKIMSASPFIILFLIIINIFGKKLRSKEKEIKINNEIINLQKVNITKVNNNSTKAYEGNTIVCVCTIGKMENRYIREFVEHYKNYGINKIFLNDNNDINGEKFEDVISDYISNSCRNNKNKRKLTPQFAVMNDCYHKNYDKYDWLIFYDVDEFIHLNNYSNVGKFLSEQKFDGCEAIYLNYVHHSDNNLLHYDNK